MAVSVEAKYAIVSVSLRVLQSNLIKFIPNLPEWKRRAVNEFDMGDFTKIFMKFLRKFWPSDQSDFTKIFIINLWLFTI
ncbi:unnamed protein product [Linum trigynum]|uniref:Amine oxidase domain-containing protein n=1 Tax=Linum trigynum TaxID=586398 RepID=A0AAV2D7A0_9ROSI